ncbi:helix-turn-helix domain-containing protein [Desulfovibrio litoralis]|uniref:Protein RodZ, contains Xre-like HTH and DUF4115 domains n=1 Tax=Desulfovibrio litoralis DSM 11393 TaxID=1121455 RepID=A0A1M7RVI6_9BACT|nr:helix-turn-helix domain-containing protein [Desulfovibrio litoralis]SHN50309.1 protein RodZ, contains Xre-like HTH and DUF4115 domains [Desulfovibrio litoralis DSM 11393]
MNLQELGAILRQKRDEKGLSLDEAANKIKLSARVIKAMEEGDISDLPHPVYARGFMKSYAEILGFDKVELAEMLNKAFPPSELDEEPEPGPIIKATSNRERNGFKILNLLIMILVFSLLCLGIWFLFEKFKDSSFDGIKQTYNSFFSNSTDETNQTQQNSTTQAPNANNTQEQTTSVNTTPSLPNTPTVSTETTQQIENITQTLEVSTRRSTKLEVTIDEAQTEKVDLAKNQSRVFEFKDDLTLKMSNPNVIKLKYNNQDFTFDYIAGSGEKTLVFPPSATN